MKTAFLLAAATAMAGLAAAPAAAQDEGNERIMMVQIPQGGDCPDSPDGDTIVVCEEIEDPYRIPSQLRQSRDPENQSWAERSRDFNEVGKFGPGSCSNIGGGSELGCSIEEIEDAGAEREVAPERRFSRKIEQARRERLEDIDGEAAATQARVEELERAYLERLESERDAPLPGESDSSDLPPIEAVDPAVLSE